MPTPKELFDAGRLDEQKAAWEDARTRYEKLESDFAASTVTYTFTGRVTDSSNNVSVNAETVTAFVAQMADDYPGSGTLRSTGAAKSQALLEALSSTLVRISADPEGDGSFTAPVEWSWSALEDLMD